MLTLMRTTLVLDDELVRRAKQAAAERGVTLSDIVNEALRMLFTQASPSVPPFRMITYGRGSTGHVTAEEMKRILNEEDDLKALR